MITPLVRTNVNGIKVNLSYIASTFNNSNQVGDGLAMRKPLFESLEEHEWEEVLRKLNKFYTNKENKSEMDKVHNNIVTRQNHDFLLLPRCASSLLCTGSFVRIAGTRRRWNQCAPSSTPNPSATARVGEELTKREIKCI